VVDDDMGDEVRVTVIAAGFDRFDGEASSTSTPRRASEPSRGAADLGDVLGGDDDDLFGDDGDDDFDVPSFLK
jgi:cell division protein FtsZ